MAHHGGDYDYVAAGFLGHCRYQRSGEAVVGYVVEQRQQAFGGVQRVERAHEHGHVEVVAWLRHYFLALAVDVVGAARRVENPCHGHHGLHLQAHGAVGENVGVDTLYAVGGRQPRLESVEVEVAPQHALDAVVVEVAVADNVGGGNEPRVGIGEHNLQSRDFRFCRHCMCKGHCHCHIGENKQCKHTHQNRFSVHHRLLRKQRGITAVETPERAPAGRGRRRQGSKVCQN